MSRVGKSPIPVPKGAEISINGANITVKGFVRFETGEGLEKKEENFAEEVAKQMAQ